MAIHAIRLTLTLLLALGATAALAEHETAGEHAKHVTQTVTLDGNDVRPSTTNLDHANVLAFMNYSAHPVKVVFTDPADMKDKIRCGLVKGSEKSVPSAPWALFSWQNDKLVGSVPPGRFASVCSLEPGSYAFTATLVTAGIKGAGPGGVLPAKGQIVVK